MRQSFRLLSEPADSDFEFIGVIQKHIFDFNPAESGKTVGAEGDPRSVTPDGFMNPGGKPDFRIFFQVRGKIRFGEIMNRPGNVRQPEILFAEAVVILPREVLLAEEVRSS